MDGNTNSVSGPHMSVSSLSPSPLSPLASSRRRRPPRPPGSASSPRRRTSPPPLDPRPSSPPPLDPLTAELRAAGSTHVGELLHRRGRAPPAPSWPRAELLHRHRYGRAGLAQEPGIRLAGRAGDAPRAADPGMRCAGRGGRREAAGGLKEGGAMEV